MSQTLRLSPLLKVEIDLDFLGLIFSGAGQALHVYDGSHIPAMNYLKYFNIPKSDIDKMMVPFPASELASIHEKKDDFSEEAELAKLPTSAFEENGKKDEERLARYLSRKKDKHEALDFARSAMVEGADR